MVAFLHDNIANVSRAYPVPSEQQLQGVINSVRQIFQMEVATFCKWHILQMFCQRVPRIPLKNVLQAFKSASWYFSDGVEYH
jgi:hypothetical protein